jgi:predicted PhzF superfamily epimerase YddE/YHI9
MRSHCGGYWSASNPAKGTKTSRLLNGSDLGREHARYEAIPDVKDQKHILLNHLRRNDSAARADGDSSSNILILAPAMASLAYTVVDAFSTTAFKGNPAAIVILPPSFDPSDETLLAVAQEFNLPMTAFIYLNHTHGLSTATHSALHLRWFNTQQESHFCGHATLAAAHVLFSRSEWAGTNIPELVFTTLAGQLKARKIGPEIELNFPAGEVRSVDDIYEGDISLRDSVVRAAKLKGEESIKAVGEGGGGDSFKHFMVVELDPYIQLKELRPNVTHFVRVHIILAFKFAH